MSQLVLNQIEWKPRRVRSGKNHREVKRRALPSTAPLMPLVRTLLGLLHVRTIPSISDLSHLIDKDIFLSWIEHHSWPSLLLLWLQ